jgi:hypothetical protein
MLWFADAVAHDNIQTPRNSPSSAKAASWACIAFKHSITTDKTIHFSDCVNRLNIPGPSDIRLHRLCHLNQLTLCGGWQDHLSLTDLPKDLEASSIKRLHITCAFQTDVLARCTTPALISMLTHLSLRTPDTTESAFDIALRHGVNLQSLRIQGYLGSPKSQHFRRYAHALPSLTEFGVFLHGHSRQPCTDLDFFPAVCDFLRPKAAQLVHLELRAPEQKSEQDKLGFNGGKECWALFKSVSRSEVAELFPKLESLSMTLPDGKKSFSLHSSKLIPKRVTRLSLSGYQLVDSSVKHIFRVVSICSPSTYMTGSFDNHPSRYTVTC